MIPGLGRILDNITGGGAGGGRGGGGFNQRAARLQNQVPRYEDFLVAQPAIYYERANIEDGGKVLLPAGVLNQISYMNIPQPMIFSVTNTYLNKHTYVGVEQFVAPDGVVYLPNWLFEQLHLEQGQEVAVALVPELSKERGNYLKFQAHEHELMKNSFDNILTVVLTKFTVLHQGDTIPIVFNKKTYHIDILDVKPKNQYNAVCIINADLNCDWEQALDYKPEEQVPRPDLIDTSDQTADDGNDKKRFPGQAITWGGKPTRKLSEQVLSEEQRKKLDEKKRMEEWDPRKHRLRHGLRSNELGQEKFKEAGKGVTIGKTR